MEITDAKRAQVVALHASGMRQVAIAQQLGMSQPLVSQTLKRFRKLDCLAHEIVLGGRGLLPRRQTA